MRLHRLYAQPLLEPRRLLPPTWPTLIFTTAAASAIAYSYSWVIKDVKSLASHPVPVGPQAVEEGGG